MTAQALLPLLHLASPALPVGGFAYSQGLERAIEDGLVRDAAGAQRWIGDLLALSLARWEAPLWLRAFDAAAAGDGQAFARCNEELLAARETAELRLETQQMGASLARVFPALGLTPPANEPLVYPAAFAAACAQLGVAREDGLAAYLWSWLENQVLVAVKSVPLGQQAGQTMLYALHGAVQAAVGTAAALREDELGSAAAGFAIACARHETQYSRLYRS
ncbi:MAG: urease accessory protein UreF [Betaproteobacteria bacterium]